MRERMQSKLWKKINHEIAIERCIRVISSVDDNDEPENVPGALKG